MKLVDEHLRERGLTQQGTGKTLVIACGALAHEILALIQVNGWTHLKLQCLPAKYHLYPEKIPGLVREAIQKGRADGARYIYVLYADCGTGGLLDKVCEEEGVERIAGPHCYSFFMGNAAFEANANEDLRAFFLTDFLVKQFDAFVWKPMGFDRHPELRDMMFGNYEKLVYISQIKDEKLAQKARDCAEKLGLAYEYRYTGYGEMEDFLQKTLPA